jgi:hypothetical protein
MPSSEQTPPAFLRTGSAVVNSDELLGEMFGQETPDKKTLARVFKPPL